MNSDRYLPPIVLQGLGAVLILAAFVFWMFTDRASALLVGTAVGLTGVGAARGAVTTLRRRVEPPPDEET